jgi:hypothetical protein
MAGYSGTPLPKKLGIKEGARVALVNAPLDVRGLIRPLPQGVELTRRAEPGLDVVVFFTMSRRELEHNIGRLKEAIAPDGAVWVAWPKRASGVVTNVTEDVVREVALPLGLVDNKVAAMDHTWSGLRLVIRVAERAGAGRAGRR